MSFGGNNTQGPIDVATAVNAHGGPAGRLDFESETFTLAIRGRGDSQELGYRTDGTANAVLTPNGGRAGIGVGAVAFSCKDHGADASEGAAPTMRAMGHDASHANAGGQLAVAFAENLRHELRTSQVTDALSTGGGKPGQGYPAALVGMQVRRLTPRECDRLQGFNDDYTLIPFHGKPAADGPRYKALGNSMAVPVMRWIGERIAAVDVLPYGDGGRTDE